VDRYGQVSMDGTEMGFPELYKALTNRYQANTNIPVYLSGSRDATHGEMVYVLGWVQKAGIQRVAFAVKADASGATR
jgi:biopolymer transport protein ExbD